MIKCFLTPQNYVTDILAGAVSHAMTNILYKISNCTVSQEFRCQFSQLFFFNTKINKNNSPELVTEATKLTD